MGFNKYNDRFIIIKKKYLKFDKKGKKKSSL